MEKQHPSHNSPIHEQNNFLRMALKDYSYALGIKIVPLFFGFIMFNLAYESLHNDRVNKYITNIF